MSYKVITLTRFGFYTDSLVVLGDTAFLFSWTVTITMAVPAVVIPLAVCWIRAFPALVLITLYCMGG